MNKKTTFTALVTSAILASSSLVLVSGPAYAAPAPTPDLHFTFDTNLSSIQGANTLIADPACQNPLVPAPIRGGDATCISNSSFGSDPTHGSYWSWESTSRRGGGLTLSVPGRISNTYSMSVKFSFADATGNYKKIIDFWNRTDDNGFYLYGGQLMQYPFNIPNSPSFANNEVLDLVITRDASAAPSSSAGIFRVYLRTATSFTKVLEINDSDGDTIPSPGEPNSIFGFFFDEYQTSSEATSAGKVWDLKLWDGYVLGDREVLSATALAGTPVPTSSPGMSGTATAGSTLTAATGSWSGTGVTYGYQWYNCTSPVTAVSVSVPAGCTPISGATSATYLVDGTESNIMVFVTGTNNLGSALVGSATVALGATATAPQDDSSDSSGDVVRPTPYEGPVVIATKSEGNQIDITGSRLAGVSRVVIGGIECKILTSTDGRLIVEPSSPLAAGTYDVVLHSADGVLTAQRAVTLSGAGTFSKFKVWTKRTGDSVKIVAKYPSGVGKLTFLVDGKRVSSFDNASDATYNLHVKNLKPGKNRFEIRLDGKRIWRATYALKR